MKRFPVSAAFLLLALPAAAATSSLLGQHDADKPINIGADHVQADLNGQTVTYSGNVQGVQGDIRLHSDTLKFDKPANKLYVKGKVVVDSTLSGTATGDNGIYDLTKKLVTLSGHVVLHKQGQVTMQGSLLTVNMVTGIANLGANPVAATPDQAGAPGVPGGRVQAVITPKNSTP